MTALVDLIDEHQRAIEADLIRLGLRLRHLGTDLLTWGDLLAVVRYAPADSALVLDMQTDDEREARAWGLTEQLLATLVDRWNLWLWAHTQDGQDGRDRPYPIPRPGVTDDRMKALTVEPSSITELNALLGWELAAPPPE